MLPPSHPNVTRHKPALTSCLTHMLSIHSTSESKLQAVQKRNGWGAQNTFDLEVCTITQDTPQRCTLSMGPLASALRFGMWFCFDTAWCQKCFHMTAITQPCRKWEAGRNTCGSYHAHTDISNVSTPKLTFGKGQFSEFWHISNFW